MFHDSIWFKMKKGLLSRKLANGKWPTDLPSEAALDIPTLRPLCPFVPARAQGGARKDGLRQESLWEYNSSVVRNARKHIVGKFAKFEHRPEVDERINWFAPKGSIAHRV
jgi:hypothetical protein